MSTVHHRLVVSCLSVALLCSSALPASARRHGKKTPDASEESKPADAKAEPSAAATPAPAAPAAAAAAPPTASSPSAAATPAVAESPTNTAKEGAAREHFMRGVDLYTQGSYASAWLEFTSAYQLVPKTALLNNMARCEVRIGRPVEALQHFKRYIAANPDDPDGTYIRQEIARLEGEVGRRNSPTEPEKSGVAEPASVPARRAPTASIIVGGLTVGLLAAGAITLGMVSSRVSLLQSTCSPVCPNGDVSVIEQQSYAGYGLLGAAGVGAVATGVLLYFELGKKRESNFKPIASWKSLSPYFVSRSD
ncbi:MAG TPA: tetratricopeptide repeat protein [Pseudomonadota bacterium]|nr:tetratricopeptide repeat protein [Pseudomonadota bacterium]HNN49877.1 tetratricopeptide repeat protein [Pseudomonadota bacterium]